MSKTENWKIHKNIKTHKTQHILLYRRCELYSVYGFLMPNRQKMNTKKRMDRRKEKERRKK